MNWFGLIIGVISFVVIGIFHPIVIQCEYHFTHKVWPIFLVGGLICCGVSLFVSNDMISAALAVLGFSMIWSVGELKEQKERVDRGWFPKNPKRK